MGLEHARVGGQLERAKPDGVDGHLEGKRHNRDNNCSLYYENVDWEQLPRDGRVLWKLSGLRWAQACPE